jgi:putative drug exporter of the RND superfamily
VSRLGRYAFRHRGWVVLARVAALSLAFGLSAASGGPFSANYSAPGLDSQAARVLMEEQVPGEIDQAVTLLVQADGRSPTRA